MAPAATEAQVPTAPAPPAQGADASGVHDVEIEAAIQRGEASFSQWAMVRLVALSPNNDDLVSKQLYSAYLPKVLAAFENACGPIVASYYTNSVGGAAVLTRKRLNRRVRRDLDEPKLSIAYNFMEASTPVTAELTDLLYQCQKLSIKVDQLLTGQERLICTEMLFGLVTDVLAILDAEAVRGEDRRNGSRPRKAVAELVRLQREELDRIDEHYQAAARRQGEFSYFRGMISALLPLVAAGAGLWGLLRLAGLPSTTLRASVASFLAGAVGAIVSVMWRLSHGRLHLKYESGRRMISIIGGFRPALGAIFGTALYFGLATKVLRLDVVVGSANELMFYSLVAFIAGFSERWFKDMLTRTGRSILPDEEPEEPPAEDEAEPRASDDGHRRRRKRTGRRRRREAKPG